MALKHFEEQGVECAVLEAGLGGRIDATSGVFIDSASHAHDVCNSNRAFSGERSDFCGLGSHAHPREYGGAYCGRKSRSVNAWLSCCLSVVQVCSELGLMQ